MWSNNARSRGESLNRYRGAYPPPTAHMVDMSPNLGCVAQLVGRKKRRPARILTAPRRLRSPGMADLFPDKSARAAEFSDGAKAGLATKGPARPVLPDMLARECAPHMRVGATRDRLRWRKIANLRHPLTTKPPNREGGNTPCYTYMRPTRKPTHTRKQKESGRAVGDRR